MSIQAEIERIQSAVTLAQNAVKEKGGILASGSGTKLDRLPNDIKSIPKIIANTISPNANTPADWGGCLTLTTGMTANTINAGENPIGKLLMMSIPSGYTIPEALYISGGTQYGRYLITAIEVIYTRASNSFRVGNFSGFQVYRPTPTADVAKAYVAFNSADTGIFSLSYSSSTGILEIKISSQLTANKRLYSFVDGRWYCSYWL